MTLLPKKEKYLHIDWINWEIQAIWDPGETWDKKGLFDP